MERFMRKEFIEKTEIFKPETNMLEEIDSEIR